MEVGIESVLYLPGSSYPADQRFEDALLPRLAEHLPATRVVPYKAFIKGHGEPRAWNNPLHRLALLEAVTPRDRSSLVLIGRSSGARIATLFARHYPIAAVVCLGYPFRNPWEPLDPHRTAHLRDLTTPTLIIQGVRDPYGGLNLIEDHFLAPATQLHFIDADHEFDVPSTQWDALANRIADFLRRRHEPVDFHGLRFDEAFYGACHRDVAEAIAAGRIESGAAHFVRHGRAERRRFRLLPNPMPPR